MLFRSIDINPDFNEARRFIQYLTDKDMIDGAAAPQTQASGGRKDDPSGDGERPKPSGKPIKLDF